MPEGRQVPWLSWEEWHQVRLGLFSAESASQSAALSQVNVWRARGKLPLSVEVTATLLGIRSRESEALSGVFTSQSETLLRLEYSMAIILLVNGVTDVGQRGPQASSVASVAAVAGLPRLLVDIRHDATHRGLPTLALLRLAADSAWAWLEASYWGRQAQQLRDNHAKVIEILKVLYGEAELAFHRAQTYIELLLLLDLNRKMHHTSVICQAQEYLHLQATLSSKGKHPQSDSDNESEAAPTPSGPLTAASMRKQCRQMLTDVAELVQPALVSQLALMLLSREILDVSENAQSGGAAWKAMLEALARIWRGLLPLLLQHGIHLAAEHCSSSAKGEAPQLPAHLLPSLQRAIASAFDALHSAAKQTGHDSVLKHEQIRHLLSTSLLALGRTWPEAGEGQEGPSQSSGQAPLGACQLLQHAAEHLTPMLAQAMPAHAPDAERADSASRKRAKLAGAIHHLTSISSHTVQPGLAHDGAAIMHPTANAPTDDQYQHLQDAERQVGAVLRRRKPATMPGKLWVMSPDWCPCAIGHLPDPIDPNGQLPNLLPTSCNVAPVARPSWAPAADEARGLRGSTSTEGEHAAAAVAAPTQQEASEVNEGMQVQSLNAETKIGAPGSDAEGGVGSPSEPLPDPFHATLLDEDSGQLKAQDSGQVRQPQVCWYDRGGLRVLQPTRQQALTVAIDIL